MSAARRGRPPATAVPTPDVVDAVIAKLRALAPVVTEDLLVDIEVTLRQGFGGGRHYVKKAPSFVKSAALGKALRQRIPLKAAINELGITSTYARRLLNRRARP